MPPLSSEETQALLNELAAGERVLWSGKPDPRVIFRASDWYVIPFSLLWGGFAIFWEAGVSGFWFGAESTPLLFMQLWGVPFVLIGQYMIWGRFFYAAWKKRRVVYALTDRQVLVMVRPPRPKVISRALRGVTDLSKEIRADGVGTIKFGEVPPFWSTYASGRNQSADGLFLNSQVPAFVDVEDADTVARLAQEAAHRAGVETGPIASQTPPPKPRFMFFGR